MAICAEKGIPYNPAQWHPGPEADAMLEEITALKTFERKNFLEKGREAPLHVTESARTHSVKNMLVLAVRGLAVNGALSLFIVSKSVLYHL